jgi:hypothetical protein
MDIKRSPYLKALTVCRSPKYLDNVSISIGVIASSNPFAQIRKTITKSNSRNTSPPPRRNDILSNCDSTKETHYCLENLLEISVLAKRVVEDPKFSNNCE